MRSRSAYRTSSQMVCTFSLVLVLLVPLWGSAGQNIATKLDDDTSFAGIGFNSSRDASQPRHSLKLLASREGKEDAKISSSPSPFEHKKAPRQYDVLTPSGAEIRLLLRTGGSELALATLPVNGVSRAIYHKAVDDMWFFIRGRGEVWRKRGDQELVLPVEPDVALTILQGTHFQYRNTGNEPLSWITATTPPWPGSDEVVFVEGPWPVK